MSAVPPTLEENAMNLRELPTHRRFLPRVLLVDAVASGATAVLLVGAADLLAPPLQLPAGLLRGAGVVLLPSVAVVYRLSRQATPPSGAVAAGVAAEPGGHRLRAGAGAGGAGVRRPGLVRAACQADRACLTPARTNPGPHLRAGFVARATRRIRARAGRCGAADARPDRGNC